MPKCIAVGEYHTSTSVGIVGGRAVDRRVAREPGEHRRLRPHRFIEVAVDLDRLIDARRLDIERSAAPVSTSAPRRAEAAPTAARPHESQRSSASKNKAKSS